MKATLEKDPTERWTIGSNESSVIARASRYHETGRSIWGDRDQSADRERTESQLQGSNGWQGGVVTEANDLKKELPGKDQHS